MCIQCRENHKYFSLAPLLLTGVLVNSLVITKNTTPSRYLWLSAQQNNHREPLTTIGSHRTYQPTLLPPWCVHDLWNVVRIPYIRALHVHYPVHRSSSPHIIYRCPRRNVPDFGRGFLMLKYTDITHNTYIQSWTVTDIMAREVWNFKSCYTLFDYQIHIKTGRNMWFL